MTTAKMILVIDHGTQTICGTDWPVETLVSRVGPRQYLVTRRLCNGVPSGAERYATQREALEAAHAA